MKANITLSLFSLSVMSDSLRPHELQHARLPVLYHLLEFSQCPLTQWTFCPLTVRWQTISSSFTPFSSCPQSFPASGSFPMSRLFASGGQSVGASASASVLSMNIQGYIEGINQGCCVQLHGWCLDAGWTSQRSAPVFQSHKSIIHSTSRGPQPSSLGLRVLFPGLISYPV